MPQIMQASSPSIMPTANIPKLDGKNYQSWIELVNIVLELRGLRHVIVGDTVDTVADLHAKFVLLGAMDESHRSQVRGCISAKTIVERLALIYADTSAANIYRLLMQYYRYDKKPEHSISEHIGRMDEMRRQLTDLGEKQSEAVYQVTLIGSLPQEYSSIMEIWELTHESMRTTPNLVSRLLKREEDLKKVSPDDKVFAVRAQRPKMTKAEIEAKKKVTPCHSCGKKGHWALECPSKQESAKVATEDPEERANVITKIEDSEQIDMTAGGIGDQELSFNVSLNGQLGDKWVSDSGASSHMANNKAWFSELTEMKNPRHVTVGDGRKLKVAAIGTVRLEAYVGEKWCIINIKGVLYVPGLATNLFSVGAAAERGVSTTFINNECVMRIGDKVVATGARLSEKLYLMRFRELTANATNTDHALAALEKTMRAYHRELGHASVDRIKKLLADLEIKIPNDVVECEACPPGKGHRTTHPSIGARATEPGHLHVDLSGKINKQSLKGYNYYMLCKDELTGFVVTYFCKTKGEVPALLQKLLVDFESIAKTPVRSIQSDQGSEFVNQVTKLLFAKEHVSHRLSATYCPQQNGRIEREMQTITNMARTMLIASKLPIELWPEAVATAVYIKNRLPTNGRSDTPYEQLIGLKPRIDHLLEFGQPVHVIVNDQYLTKWDPRTRQGFLVGYTPRQNTYKVFIAEKNQVIETCDIIVAPHEREQEDVCCRIGSDSGQCDVSVINLSDTSISSKNTPASDEKNNRSVIDTCESGQTSHVSDREGRLGDISHSSTDSCMYKTPNKRVDFSTPKRSCTGKALEEFFHSFREDNRQPSEDDEPIYEEIEIPSPPFIPNEEQTPEPSLTDEEQRKKAPNLALLSCLSDHNQVPLSYEQATDVSGPDASEWAGAIKAELDAHALNDTWSVVQTPSRARPLSTKWVFTLKKDSEGNVVRHKARLVARGFEQRQGIDYEQTFAPVAKLDSLRLLLAIAAGKNLKVLQFDVSTAFLYGKLREEVFIQTPKGVSLPVDHCLRLNKALYGLKQAPRAWNSTFCSELHKLGFVSLKMDPCVFVNSQRTIFILIYVDDAIIIGEDEAAGQRIIDELGEQFSIKQLKADYFLGIKIDQDETGIKLSQQQYALDIAARFNLADANPASSPIADTKSLMMADSAPTDAPYREAVGCLQYLACCTRPDIMFAVCFLARFNHKPLNVHWEAAKRLIRFVKATSYRGLVYKRITHPIRPLAYSDADWANDIDDRRSTTGLMITLGAAPIIFASRKQRDTALSSTHAEYYAACDVVSEIKWMRQLLDELGVVHERPRLFIDNHSTIHLVKNQDTSRKSKHIDTKYHFIREQAERELFSIHPISSVNQLADLLTKPLSGPKIKQLIEIWLEQEEVLGL